MAKPQAAPTASVPVGGAVAGASFCISRGQSFEVPDKPGWFCSYWPKGQTDTILSIQPDGTFETRPKDQAGGAWETWKSSKDGNRAIFPDCSEVFALPLVD